MVFTIRWHVRFLCLRAQCSGHDPVISLPPRSRWLPSRLNASVTRHYKLTHPTSGVKPSSLLPQHPSPGEISTTFTSLVYLLYTLRCSTMKFSQIFVLYLSLMVAPSALAVPLRFGDRCSSGSAGVRCIRDNDDHGGISNSLSSGVSTLRELFHRNIPCIYPLTVCCLVDSYP